ncbi:MAG: hypothetical protein H7Y13_02770 [Sphingobacteriaceae bacterium]|nr:hypothetical protein [Sphingobacteriaceae bacterium]
MKKLIYTSGICIVLSSACSSDKSSDGILFASPQPQSGKQFQKFPASVLGEYWAEGKDVSLNIRDDGMFLNTLYPAEAHIRQLDSMHVLIGDSIIRDKELGIDYPARRWGDSVSFNLNYVDTLFTFDENHVLSKLKNSYILNSRKRRDGRRECWKKETGC